MPKVSGSRIEMVASGPMPGSTPTMLPTSTPTKHQSRLCGSSATPKPYQRSVSACWIMAAPSGPKRTENRERNLQHIGKQQAAEEGDAKRQQERALPGRGAVAHCGDEHAGKCARCHAAIFAEHHEQDRPG